MITDIVYLSNHYFFSESKTGIWRKSIENHSEEPSLFFREDLVTQWPGRTLKAAFLEKAIIFNRKKEYLMAIEVKQDGAKGRDMVIMNPVPERDREILAFEVTGAKQDEVVSLNREGWLAIQSIDLGQKKSEILCLEKLNLFQKMREESVSFKLSPRGDYILVHTRNKHRDALRLLVLQRSGEFLINKTYLKFDDLPLNYIYFFEVLRVSKDHIYFTGVTKHEEEAVALTFSYDWRRNVLERRPGLRTALKRGGIWKGGVFESVMYGVDQTCGLVKIKLI